MPRVAPGARRAATARRAPSTGRCDLRGHRRLDELVLGSAVGAGSRDCGGGSRDRRDVAMSSAIELRRAALARRELEQQDLERDAGLLAVASVRRARRDLDDLAELGEARPHRRDRGTPRAALSSLGTNESVHAGAPFAHLLEHLLALARRQPRIPVGGDRRRRGDGLGARCGVGRGDLFDQPRRRRRGGAALGDRPHAFADRAHRLRAETSTAPRCSAPPARSAVRSNVSSACASSMIGSTPTMPASPFDGVQRARKQLADGLPAPRLPSRNRGVDLRAGAFRGRQHDSSTSTTRTPPMNSLEIGAFRHVHWQQPPELFAGSVPARTASPGSPTHRRRATRVVLGIVAQQVVRSGS